jgi:hypothetical protein
MHEHHDARHAAARENVRRPQDPVRRGDAFRPGALREAARRARDVLRRRRRRH